MSDTSSPTPWVALLPAALAGTRRQPFAPLPGLTPPLGAEADAGAKQLLLTAAGLLLVQQAGQQPQSGPAGAPPPAPPETWPAVPAAAARRLAAWLAELPVELANTYQSSPPEQVLLAVLAELRRWGHRLPPRLLLRLLRQRWVTLPEPRAARLVLGERGQWLHQRLGNSSGWYTRVTRWLNPAWLKPDELAADWNARVSCPMPPDDSYVDAFGQLPDAERTRLLWVAWQVTEGKSLPAALQPALTALLAATPPAEWPWSARSMSPTRLAMVGHPLLGPLWTWATSLLTLTRSANGLPHLRIELPTANLDAAGRRLSTWGAYFGQRREAVTWLQELLFVLGPRIWADAWGLSPAGAVALVAATERGELVLEAWAYYLARAGHSRAEPEWVQALLDTPQLPALLMLRAWMLPHLPSGQQVAWLTTILPADLAAPTEQWWVRALTEEDTIPLESPELVRRLLPVLAAALAQPRTRANAEQCAGLPGLLHKLAARAPAGLWPEVEAALAAVVPAQPRWKAPLELLRQSLALRHALWQACGAPDLTA